MRCLYSAFFLWGALLAGHPSALLAAALPDPGMPGLYAVGFAFDTAVDVSRPDADDPTGTGRAIPVFIWYPVDPATLDAQAPLARYPLAPFPADASAWVSSERWETYGLDRAYDAPHPSADGPFPLLIYSPGLGGEPADHISLGTRLASHGIVVAVVHPADPAAAPGEPPVFTVPLYNRPRDLSFVLTDLLERRNVAPGDPLHGLLRPDAVAAGGYSLGGYTAMALAGGDDDVCNWPAHMTPESPEALLPPGDWCVPTPPDPRFRAIVTHDGSNQFLFFDELKRIAVPMLGLGEEWDDLLRNSGFENASWQARQHAALSVKPAYRVDVFNTNHASYTDACEYLRVLHDLGQLTSDELSALLGNFCVGVTPSLVVHDLVSKYTIAFLKTQLTRVPGYGRLLSPGWVQRHEHYIELFTREKVPARFITADWPPDYVYFKHQPSTCAH